MPPFPGPGLEVLSVSRILFFLLMTLSYENRLSVEVMGSGSVSSPVA